MTIFSLLLALAAVLGLVWIMVDPPLRLRNASLTAAVLVMLAALIGGRVAYVAPNGEYFQNHLIEIPQVGLGGLAWPGALAGAVLGTLIAVIGVSMGVMFIPSLQEIVISSLLWSFIGFSDSIFYSSQPSASYLPRHQVFQQI